MSYDHWKTTPPQDDTPDRGHCGSPDCVDGIIVGGPGLTWACVDCDSRPAPTTPRFGGYNHWATPVGLDDDGLDDIPW